MKIYYFLLVLLCLSCEISGEQEERLSQQLNKYLKAYNNKQTLQLAALSAPHVVRFYHQKGDSMFIEHFETDLKKSAAYLSNPLVDSDRSDSKSIQRKYWVEKYTGIDGITNRYRIFAISSDQGNSWFFVTEDDYFDDDIPGLKRLFQENE